MKTGAEMLSLALQLLDDRHSEYCGFKCTCPITETELRAWFSEYDRKQLVANIAMERASLGALWKIRRAINDELARRRARRKIAGPQRIRID